MDLSLDPVFHAIAFSLDNHCFSMMEQTIQDSGGESAVVVKYLRPLFEDAV
ncbi:MAG: hypothetical protein SCALA701_02310 [Candidatus Scalindua sp.]|nr:MAG: hypothetical protein SCALA701_02310 [Candidatus Scalindua sp.]